MADPRRSTKPATPRHHDHAYAMLLGFLLLVFSDDWHWGVIGAVIFLGGLVVALIHEMYFGGGARRPPEHLDAEARDV